MSVGGGGGEGAPMMEMNTTPLIDVMLVLIVMLIITLPVMTHAVKLDMPPPDNTPPEVEPELITITIDYDGTIIWNETPVPNLATLERYFKIESKKVPQPQVAIRPDARAKYDSVAQVMASAQRNRIEKMGLIGDEQFE
ncbi:MAG: biopolymer transporter ExbD [Chromatiales bacterium]|jgi:biopolymer transport protein ExbD|nr:MAG: biopolymer transporter ExbD [Chromatiales bacterium]